MGDSGAPRIGDWRTGIGAALDSGSSSRVEISNSVLQSKENTPANQILAGFIVLYSFSVITSAAWMFHPAPWPAVWCAEFAIQGAALFMWLRSSGTTK